MSTDTKILKFTKPWRGYNKGEVAGFDAKTAEALVNGNVAEEHDGSQDGKRPAQRPQQAHAQRRTAKTASDSAGQLAAPADPQPAGGAAGEEGAATAAPASDAAPVASGPDDARP